ncbi:type VI secretion system ATPase TssH [Tistrella sp.]|nr:type VI secretion system ATPase TssH [Tistrella sp.]MAD35953.1 type VI secretion system ATPase TssH [Tistrella sp.]
MATTQIRSLVDKLNRTCRKALEAAAGNAVNRGNPAIEIEHWLRALVADDGAVLPRALAEAGVAVPRALTALDGALDRLRTGNDRAPALAPGLIAMIRQAWTVASIEDGADRIGSGHLLVAALRDELLSQQLAQVIPVLGRLSADQVLARLPELADGSDEAAGSGPAAAEAPLSSLQSGKALTTYAIDLTEAARAGRLDPVLGRDDEIAQVIDILSRRRQNNPILTGEAGVGKTAVVEGLALRVAAGEVPAALARARLLTLDLGLLQAGAGVKGEFENRLKSVIDEVKASADPVILFIDEAHTLIGAGGAAGQGDAANLLKPALARGELRTIAATTWAEYKRHVERDPALARRFQVVKVEEPSEARAVTMLRGLVEKLEAHHGVHIHDAAVEEAVRLSARYLPERQLPDKAVSVLDTAAARVAMGRAVVPQALQRRRSEHAALERARDMRLRDAALGGAALSVETLIADMASLEAEIAEMAISFAEESRLVAELAEARAMEEPAARAAAQSAVLEQLKVVQGKDPLLPVDVDARAVAAVISDWTGIPLGRMADDELETVRRLEDRLRTRIIGQDHALEAVARAVRTRRAGLDDPRRPAGVFLFAGTSGVGKTETAVALAELLHGDARALTVINLSEFKEEHKVSMLLGAPPGYVGYGEGGVLTEAVRRRPHGVVLLDEIEKAHPGVQDVFYRIFDEGRVRDGEGREIDFRNVTLILTTNAGSETITKLMDDPDTAPGPEGLAEALEPVLRQSFKPAFLGRLKLVPFMPLDDERLLAIVNLQLDRAVRRITETYDLPVTVAPEVASAVLARARARDAGARAVEAVISGELMPGLAGLILDRLAEEGAPPRAVEIATGPDGSLTPRLS